jgi:glycerophosphoryl diester phosphodiesterase
VAHDAGLQVAVWCPEPEQGDRLLAAGVDCLVVDDVAAAAAHYRERRDRVGAPIGKRPGVR